MYQKIKQTLEKSNLLLLDQLQKVYSIPLTCMKDIQLYLSQHLDSLSIIGQFFSSNKTKAKEVQNNIQEIKTYTDKKYEDETRQLEKLQKDQTDFLQQEIKLLIKELWECKSFSKERIEEIEEILNSYLNKINEISNVLGNQNLDVMGHITKLLINLFFSGVGIGAGMLATSYGASQAVASCLGPAGIALGATVSNIASDKQYRNKIQSLIQEVQSKQNQYETQANEKKIDVEKSLLSEVQKLLSKINPQFSEKQETGKDQQQTESIAWLDLNIKSYENEKYCQLLKNQFPCMNYCFTNSIDELIQHLQQTSITYVIISGSYGEQIINKLLLSFNIRSIIVFCSNVKIHQEWSQNYQLVSKVTNKFNEVIKTISNQINQLEYVGGCSLKYISNHLKQKFQYYISPDFSEYQLCDLSKVDIQSIICSTLNIFPERIKNKYFNSALKNEKFIEQEIKENFQSIEKVIFFYTKEGPFYKTLNTVLNMLNLESINSFSFFIKTVRYCLFNYNDNQQDKFKDENLRLYRGLDFDPIQFKKQNRINDVFIFPAFTSTTRKKEQAMHFTQKSKFILEICFDPVEFGQQFDLLRPKSIEKISQFSIEDEFLFPCFSAFQVLNYEEDDGYTIAKIKYVYLGNDN